MATAAQATFTALADPHRRDVLALLLERPRPVAELTEALRLTQPGTSKHLRVLREAGLVRVRRTDAGGSMSSCRSRWPRWTRGSSPTGGCGTRAWTRWSATSTSPSGGRTHETRHLRDGGRAGGGALRARAAPPRGGGVGGGHRAGELAHWFPSAVAFDALAPGAGITFTFPQDAGGEVMTGEVLRAEPPRRLVFTWGGSTIDIALEPTADGTRLTFLHLLEAADEAARTAAGWDVCLEHLERALGGEDVAAPGGTPTPDWRERYAAYEARGFPAGAPVPGGA